MQSLSRRAFGRTLIAGGMGASLGGAFHRAEAQPYLEPKPQPIADTPALTIIDTHTHFYDPARAAGVPWPPEKSALYRTVLPKHYRQEKTPRPVTGTVVVEASVWLEDNQWILDIADDDPFIVGFVGNIEPGQPKFAESIQRFSQHKLYRGIRVRADVLKQRATEAAFLKDMHLLADADLSLDVNGGVAILPMVDSLAKAVPKLRIVIDHVGGYKADGKPPQGKWVKLMAAAARHPQVNCKVSGMPEAIGRDGKSPVDLAVYKPLLDHLWEVFGDTRVIYGSNWPVCELGTSLFNVQNLMETYLADRPHAVQQRYFADNAKTVYKWIDRSGQKSEG